MIPDELKHDLNNWFDKRIKEWGELKKLHYSLLGMSKEEYPVAWQGMIDDIIFAYNEMGNCLVDGDGKITCMPREIKQDIVPYIRRKAQDYTGDAVKQAEDLAETLQNRVPTCTLAGRVNRQWLKRRGYTKEDLTTKDNITQVGKKEYKGLELE